MIEDKEGNNNILKDSWLSHSYSLKKKGVNMGKSTSIGV